MTEIEAINYKLNLLAEKNTDILAVLLVGSYARNKQHEKSDIDIMVITTDEMKYFSDYNWIKQFAETDVIEKENWGIVNTLRFFSGQTEIELNICSTEWITLPLDTETERVLLDGYKIIFERNDSLHEIKNIIHELS
ncbi:MAG TPA: nucleotidyltransferase domain-containing protein [Spirochaetota bacterium]|nr:nucleotidyltransferase domain-containing protein [Spirochaetota bacterium]HOR44983.1 nucleotidyltransferase domain-containing protein [Spirochaetota bacterium]HPK56690.1 nucleotidyltransferase domain-containing protein [Spirochaetota bacterium]